MIGPSSVAVHTVNPSKEATKDYYNRCRNQENQSQLTVKWFRVLPDCWNISEGIIWTVNPTQWQHDGYCEPYYAKPQAIPWFWTPMPIPDHVTLDTGHGKPRKHNPRDAMKEKAAQKDESRNYLIGFH
ncbi:hypothetical protein QQM79_20695 [Marinobacteraceae bacterium S3BR75-40.1]